MNVLVNVYFSFRNRLTTFTNSIILENEFEMLEIDVPQSFSCN